MGKMLRKIRDNFALKISLSFCALIITASFFLVYLYIQERRDEKLNQMVQDGVLISQMLAHNSRMAVFTGSRSYLKAPVEGAVLQKNITDVMVSGVRWEEPYVKSKNKMVTDLNRFKHECPEMIKSFSKSLTPIKKIYDDRIEFWAPVISRRDIGNALYFTSIDSSPETEVVGTVKLVMDKTGVNKELTQFAIKIVSILITLIIAGFIITYLIVQRLTSHLGRLTGAVEIVSNGGTPDLLKIESKDEIGKLAKAFNIMTESIKERDRALLSINLKLEKKVAERTRDLLISANKLQKEIEVRKNVESVLKESEEKYRNIIESIDEGYFETTEEGIITFSNTAFGKYAGKYGKLTGEHILGFFPEDEKDKIQALLIKSKGKRKKITDTVKYEERFIEISVSPILEEDKIKGMRGFLLDVTERLIQEENRKILTKKLQEVQRLESIGTLAGGIAHDFNNLLMGIQGNISLITIKSNEKNIISKHIINIEDCVKRASDLTGKLLGFAKGGKSSIRPVILSNLIKNSVKKFAGSGININIHEKYTDDLWVVEADISQLEQVLLNIFANAYNAMDGKGDLYIETKNTIIDDYFIKPVDIEPGNFIHIKIKDNGCGMRENVKSRIFEPFYTTKPMGSESGKGMGLASVFGIIRKHKGFINVESTYGIGSSFNIFLPATEKKLSVTATDEKQPKRMETLLLVDNEEMILEVGKPMLEEIGFNVITAKGRVEASRIFTEKSSEIDMVIMDSIEGYDLNIAREFREKDPDIKILLSGTHKASIPDRYDGFISKPFTMTKLSRKISEIILDDKINH